MSPRDRQFAALLAEHGISFETDIRPGANYEVAVEHAGLMYISGLIPRVQGVIAPLGKLGAPLSLDEGRQGARISTLRALAILQQRLGSLERVERVLKLNVFVHSAPDFTQQSEVADAASEIIYALFAPLGGHTRTSVGVVQLPKNAAVELDMVVALQSEPLPC